MSETFLKIPINEYDHIRGPIGAPVTFFEYGDFECPFCANAFLDIEKILEDFETSICLVYRHFPLRNIHPHAELAALAAEAAGQQDQFWQMHQLLYENQGQLSSDTIIQLANNLRLNMNDFKEDLTREDLIAKVGADFMGGIRSGVNGTPTIFLNNVRFNGQPNYWSWSQAIQNLLTSGREGAVSAF